MKKVIKSLAMLAVAGSFLLTSCSKDEEKKTTTTGGPTVTMTDVLGTNKVDIGNPTVYVRVKVTPESGTTLKSAGMTLKLNSTTISSTPDTTSITGTDINGYEKIDTLESGSIFSSLGVKVGDVFEVILTVVDSKGKSSSGKVSFTVYNDNAVLTSTEIELGAQNDTAHVYKFLGIANNFATYTAGASGTAKTNSDKIDFVYYYGSTQKNAFASPTNTDGAQVIWNSEIASWTTKNDTKFKTTTLTATDFDNIKNSTKIDDQFASIDFTTGAVDKITDITNNMVFAFMTASGKKGLVKFTATAADNMGSSKLYVICQN